MICTTPRSGSTLLCKMLAATGQAGCPDSHFHTPSLDRWCATYDVHTSSTVSRYQTIRAVVDAELARGMGSTDVFGLRMQRGSFAYFIEQLTCLAPGPMRDTERLDAVFGQTTLIHLTRPDRLGQAISRLRAEQSGVWHRNADGTVLERLSAPQDPHYDADAIAGHMQDLAALDAAWVDWFQDQNVTPLRITYETLSTRPQDVLAEILSALELDPAPASRIQAQTAKLADAQSDAWRERFQRDRGNEV